MANRQCQASEVCACGGRDCREGEEPLGRPDVRQATRAFQLLLPAPGVLGQRGHLCINSKNSVTTEHGSALHK